MVSQEMEEYLECMFRLKEKGQKIKGRDIALLLGVTPASVTEMIKKLAVQGFVKHSPYKGIELTGKGERIGKKILRKHRFLESFLSYLGIHGKKAHNEACKLEHVISDDLERAIGTKIRSTKWENTNIIPITELSKGKKAKIAYIAGGRNAIKRLTDMGLTPGTSVTTKRDTIGCPVQICVRKTCLCVGKGIAKKIFVEV